MAFLQASWTVAHRLQRPFVHAMDLQIDRSSSTSWPIWSSRA